MKIRLRRKFFSLQACVLMIIFGINTFTHAQNTEISTEANTLRNLSLLQSDKKNVDSGLSLDLSSLTSQPSELPHAKHRKNPAPPQLPRNFSWKGRYIVADLIDPRTGTLGIDVPFTWEGVDGDVQMIAGGENYPIYFTNFIYQNHLYTYTYKWPGLQPEFLPPLEPCEPLLEFSLEDLNAILATASYVGPLILEKTTHLKRCQRVNHFRVPIVTPPPQPPGFYFRLPLILGDFFVDSTDSSKFWQVLHFGIQNLYDPNLDEWIFIQKFKDCPGKIILPPACDCTIH